MSDIVFGGWSDTWRTDLGYASVRSPGIRPPPQTISYIMCFSFSLHVDLFPLLNDLFSLFLSPCRVLYALLFLLVPSLFFLHLSSLFCILSSFPLPLLVSNCLLLLVRTSAFFIMCVKTCRADGHHFIASCPRTMHMDMRVHSQGCQLF